MELQQGDHQDKRNNSRRTSKDEQRNRKVGDDTSDKPGSRECSKRSRFFEGGGVIMDPERYDDNANEQQSQDLRDDNGNNNKCH